MMVDREKQLAVLRKRLAECAGGVGGALTVTGPVACGKTALLRAAEAPARSLGFEVRAARAADAGRREPLGLLRRLFMAERLPADLPHGGAPWVRMMNTIWAGAVTARPLLLSVDDADEADEASLRCLDYFVRRARSAPVLVMVSERSRAGRAVRPVRPCHEVVVGPVGADGVTEMARRRLSPRAAERLGPGLHRLSGGNPLLVRALLADLDGYADTLEQAVGHHYRQAVVALLRRAGGAELQVARCLAVLGDQGFPELLERMPGLDGRAVDAAVTALGAAGLLLDGRFRHPAARLAVIADTGQRDREELHRRAAELAHGVAWALSRELSRELSDAEQRVATLAAHGYRNREIAKRLSITVSTVEQHLTKIYRKLNIDGRASLRRAVPPQARTPDLVSPG
ncbi:AAA family ATPase [Nonomuraea sp. NN258]|uniref:helix-turn-helix transcriptional regulator n=1 Tax=Nonomuraea antri TaxID=2730852 RepID=UPI0015691CCC|nr:LuxR family transcriptional regulator [Nonomuraea antri]NRQ31664.1 AAA family ATPase [Nonomuraea antri]